MANTAQHTVTLKNNIVLCVPCLTYDAIVAKIQQEQVAAMPFDLFVDLAEVLQDKQQISSFPTNNLRFVENKFVADYSQIVHANLKMPSSPCLQLLEQNVQINVEINNQVKIVGICKQATIAQLKQKIAVLLNVPSYFDLASNDQVLSDSTLVQDVNNVKLIEPESRTLHVQIPNRTLFISLNAGSTMKQVHQMALEQMSKEEMLEMMFGKPKGIDTLEPAQEKEVVRNMLIRENELRLGAEYQAKYEQAEKSESYDWMEVTNSLQHQVCEEFGLCPSYGLQILRNAQYQHPEYKPLANYIKFNRARDSKLQAGMEAPDGPLYNLKSNLASTTLHTLLEQAPVTLVIAGSYTWPPIRGLIPMMKDMMSQYSNKVQFVFVYILEAHAQDEWPIRSSRFHPQKQPILYNQPTTLQERAQIAQDFVTTYEFDMPMYLDDMNNWFENAYCCWPLRFYVTKGKQIEFKAMPRNCSYDVFEVQSVLDKLL